ncbi:MAG: FGGY family carbohydrate kinase, partial [Rikenellaceae bacterium]
MEQYNFLAFDLGATSGRTILGTIQEGKIELKELTRFPNRAVNIADNYYWNIYLLYESIVEGLYVASKEGVKISSIGIDTWGVDFVFVGEDDKLLGLPYAYRDPHTLNICDEFFEEHISKEQLYERTGIQIMNFNTIFQLYAMRRNKCTALDAASTIMFMPDALAYLLSGSKVTEYTIASTSQMLNPYTREFDSDILSTVGIDKNMFAPIVMPGNVIGHLRQSVAEQCNVEQLKIIAVGGHDTASAIASIPATDRNFAYLSSGT